jgi:histidinol-phosphate aminotransferase
LVELPKLGYTVWPSSANFVLFGGVASPHGVFEALLERDIIIRDLGIPHHLRVTAGTEEETTLFLEALAEVGGAVSSID